MGSYLGGHLARSPSKLQQNLAVLLSGARNIFQIVSDSLAHAGLAKDTVVAVIDHTGANAQIADGIAELEGRVGYLLGYSVAGIS